MSATEVEAVDYDYVRVKRKNQTIFIFMAPTSDTGSALKARLNAVTKVPAIDMKLFIDKNGDVVLDDNKTLADQKVENDQELYLIFRKEGSDDWELIEAADIGGVPS
uniref:Ubiquitin-like domain-containing protein n=1 Tax=Coccolithus braarudii TaxID=221442 RepID=A0A7S0PZ59_9EUKA|mmetsp:Transcript_15780/g.34252  ORF Transcript_15780/g.34252 Transcript_15780/m.34252 type:complete len:107 (+) Transcript_15780:83-403(+)